MSHKPRRRHLVLAAVLLLTIGYGAFILIVRVSGTLLPGNGMHAPSALSGLPGLPAPTDGLTKRINILVLGVDHRPGKPNEYGPHSASAPEDPGRSDTIAVVTIDPATKTAAILSIPRDLWIEVPDGHGGWTSDRVNEAYRTGEVDRLPGGGPAAAAAAVTHNFGIPIDHYVALDFAGFTQLVDALGGIDIEVPHALTATVLPKANDGAYEYAFFEGREHLNGELALAYSRFRLDAEGDFGRIKRQQAIVLAARERALSLGWINHPVSVWDKYSSAMQTDLPAYQLPGFALLAKQIESRGITSRSLGEDGATREVILRGSGADVLFPNPGVIAGIIAETFDDPSLGQATQDRLGKLYPDPAAAAIAAGAPVIATPLSRPAAAQTLPRTVAGPNPPLPSTGQPPTPTR